MILAALLLPVMLWMVAFAIDIGILCLVRTELQRTADSAALAAVFELGTIDSEKAMEEATSVAVTYVELNPALRNQPIIFDPQDDVTFGRARINDEGTKAEFTAGTDNPNAVQVTVSHDVNFFFARIFGMTSGTVTATAIASAKSRDYMVVIDCSGSMTKQTDDDEVALDLLALGLEDGGDDGGGKKKKSSGNAKQTALKLTYDGSFPEFASTYEVGEMWLHPDIRIQPLAATKIAAALSVNVIDELGYDDMVGAVAYSSRVDWVEPLTTDYARVQAKLRGATKYGGTKLHDGIRAAREELQSERTRAGAQGVIVLMTDGNSSAPLALIEAQLAVDAGMIVHCVGLGTNVDDDLLDEIAELGGGVALYVDNTTDPDVYGPGLEEVFRQIAEEEVGHGLIQ